MKTVIGVKNEEARRKYGKAWDDLLMKQKIELIDTLMTTFACHEVKEAMDRYKIYKK
jgi:hypothetical protein